MEHSKPPQETCSSSPSDPLEAWLTRYAESKLTILRHIILCCSVRIALTTEYGAIEMARASSLV